jgi:tRNA-specific 2-thiouridylase
LQKPEVRRIAAELNLASADRKDSQGICFVGKVDLPVFLQQKLTAKSGNIIEVDKDYYTNIASPNPDDLSALAKPISYNQKDGKVIGKHQGAQFFTIGQRKGLNIGGKAEPLFVISTDIENNIVYTGMGQEHPGLFRNGLFINSAEVHWVRPDRALKNGKSIELLARIRYRQPLQEAMLHCRENGIYIIFKKPQRGVTAGQFAAWYDNDELIGSGVINE